MNHCPMAMVPHSRYTTFGKSNIVFLNSRIGRRPGGRNRLEAELDE